MNVRLSLGLLGCAVLLLGALSACSPASKSADNTPVATTTTRAPRSTTALPSVGYIHNHATLVRDGAGLAYKAIGGVVLGEQITIVGKTGDWYEIQFDENTTGFVSGHFVRFTPWVSTTTAVTTTRATSQAETTTARSATTTQPAASGTR